MLSRLLFVRLKAAENALRDGQLDEAYRMATAPDLCNHRRGVAVLSSLAERFIDRARTHFRADRFAEAQMDLDRAEAGGVLKTEISELRQNIQTVATEARREENSRRDLMDAAKRRVQGGSLAAGRQILEQAGNSDHEARRLGGELQRRADEAHKIVEQAEKLLSQGQLAKAAERIRRAKAIDAHDDAVMRTETALCNRVLQNARDALVAGRIPRASDELSCLRDLGAALPARRELDDMIATARRAATAMADGRYSDARAQGMALHRLLPEAKWLDDALEKLRQADELRTALCAGPLGDATPKITGTADPVVKSKDLQPGRGSAPVRRPGSSEADTIALPRPDDVGSLPRRLLLLVDGGGSYLILRGGRASVGRVASDDPADIPLFSDIAQRHANIERVDDDYFLFSAKDVEVGGRKVLHHLLRDGDRIVLGRKAKMTFRVPSRRSATAVLDLSDTTKVPNDVRRVVLFDGNATLGEGPHAHIRCRHAGPQLVLFERDDELWVRQRSDGHVDTEALRLRIGQPVEIGGAGLVLEPWHVRPPGLTRI